MPAAGVCISPWTDMAATGQSYTTNAENDPSVSRERILKNAGVYLDGKDPRAPVASPTHAALPGLPTRRLQVGASAVPRTPR